LDRIEIHAMNRENIQKLKVNARILDEND